ncbi:MAG: glycosyltransferase [Saprospiraceae bacterium]|nr:glycosyltransferase [Saprospiraceae bacterium]
MHPTATNNQPQTSQGHNAPTFSIVTVVYNGAELLAGTIQSVQSQTYPHLEYIIVDGASKDQTLDIVREYAAKMPYMRWISEKDRGLYDAMNKGLRIATGDFIQFLNCGDHLHAPDTIEQLAHKTTRHTDVIFGETLLVDETRQPAGVMSELSTRKLPSHLNWRDYLNGMLVVHQSFIPRRALAPEYVMDNLCADYDWCIKILKNSRENINAGVIITDYLMGGMSKQRHRQSLKDRFSVMRSHFGIFLTLAAHLWIVVRAAMHRLSRIGKKHY